MRNWLFPVQKTWKDCEPCDHPGCLAHLSHPCEGCGRIGGRNDVAAQIVVYLRYWADRGRSTVPFEQIVYTIGQDHGQTRKTIYELERTGALTIDNLYLVELVQPPKPEPSKPKRIPEHGDNPKL